MAALAAHVRRVTALVALLVVAALLTAPSAAAQEDAYPPEGDGRVAYVSSSRVEAGDCITFGSTSGFAAGSPVVVSDDGVVLGTTTADANGGFTYNVCFASDARIGVHVLRATGVDGNLRPRALRANVTVLGVRITAGDGDGETDGAGVGSGRGLGSLPRTGAEWLLATVLTGALLVLVGIVLAALPARRGSTRRRRRTRTA